MQDKQPAMAGESPKLETRCLSKDATDRSCRGPLRWTEDAGGGAPTGWIYCCNSSKTPVALHTNVFSFAEINSFVCHTNLLSSSFSSPVHCIVLPSQSPLLPAIRMGREDEYSMGCWVAQPASRGSHLDMRSIPQDSFMGSQRTAQDF